MQDNRLYSFLALAGASPLVACAVLLVDGVETIPGFGSLDVLACSYGLAIVSFLAGAHWATYMFKQSETPFNLFVSSNVVFLAVWFAFVLASLDVALLTQVLAFLFLLFVDHRMLLSGLISRNYFQVRATATALAVASLLAIVIVH
ncbi:MAG: DUF3429 domain-containing protein [Gammaproteobacteria bacterium]|nr:DUF3429 domain-containing protein [Gammaproteobacteria bacterium]MDH3372840.1 DUF3429 domain-containing protein [Gammaproteobacteria bacterium]MDH3407994.1 DUF3429 domain-containing protein [Gammaproteobacteria bacterium]MDH3552435.1 DUF3429 domain-containing protein [Gammaproteobacteria bacterium]